VTDKEAIIALLRAAVELPPEKCRNTIREALRQMDRLAAEQLKKAAR